MFEYLLQKKGALFDLDGTIIDTERLWEIAIYNTLDKIYKVDWVFLDNKKYEFGTSLEEKIKKIIKLEHLEKDLTDSLQNITTNINNEYLTLIESLDEIELKNGFINFLAYLKADNGFKVGLTTNTIQDVAMQVLEKADIAYLFDITVFGDDVKKAKPDPAIYNKAAKDLGVLKNQIIVFEDSLPGVKASLDAGLDTVVVWNRKHLIEEYPSTITDVVDDFSAYLGTVGKDLKEIMKPMDYEGEDYSSSTDETLQENTQNQEDIE